MAETKPMPADSRRSARSIARLVALAAIAVYVILFIVFNSDRVKVSFVFFETRTTLLLALLLAAGLGFVAGYLVRRSRAGKGRS
jgi:uncharacterized integral membrane protein